MQSFRNLSLTVMTACAAMALSCLPASAQGADDWYGAPAPQRPYGSDGGPYQPYGDRYDAPPPQGGGSYDNRDPGDDRYDPDDDRANSEPDYSDPRASAPRDDDRPYDSGRYNGNDGRYDDPRGDRPPPAAGPPPPSQPYQYAPYQGDHSRADPRDDRGYYDDRDVGYGAWDATPKPEDEERLSKTPGKEAGGKPSIQAAAPPVVRFTGSYAPGSIVIDTGGRKLYYVINASAAYAYPIAVGRQGFTWTGKEKVSRVVDWPDWYPPADMRKRKPELPERMLGGINNPLGAKAIYLGSTLYRIHGTNEPKSIGKAESSGCFRMLNENVLHLASLVKVGTEVNVVRSLNGAVAQAAKPTQTARAKDVPAQPQPRPRWTDDRPYGRYSDDWRY